MDEAPRQVGHEKAQASKPPGGICCTIVFVLIAALPLLFILFMYLLAEPSPIPTLADSRISSKQIRAKINEGTFPHPVDRVYLLRMQAYPRLHVAARFEKIDQTHLRVNEVEAEILATYETHGTRRFRSEVYEWDYHDGFKRDSYVIRIKALQKEWQSYAQAGELYIFMPLDKARGCIEMVDTQ